MLNIFLAVDNLVLLVGNRYLASLILLALSTAISRLAVLAVRSLIVHIVLRTKTNMDNLIVKAAEIPIFLILAVLCIRFSMIPLELGSTLSALAFRSVTSIIVVIIAFILMRVIDIVIDEWARDFALRTLTKRDDEILPIFHKAAEAIVLIVAVLVIFSIWSVEITPMLASLGIAGVVVGFALQNSLSNIFGGIALILDKAFKVGDVVKLESGTIGTIVDIGLRSTKLRSPDNELIMAPNGALANSQILNFNRPEPMVRVVVDFTIQNGSDIEKVKGLVLEQLSGMENIRKEPKPAVMLTEFSEFGLRFQAYFFVDELPKKMPAKEAALINIYNAFRKQKIELVFPGANFYSRIKK